jgi:hypothetical protein
MAIVVEINAQRPESQLPSTLKTEITAYRTLVQSLIDRHQPASHEEEVLVQSLADIEWRLRRIPSVEAGIYAIGRRELADVPSEYHDPEIRAALIVAETFMKYQREFCDLSRQETRLLRVRRKDLARLRQIQVERPAANSGNPKPQAGRGLQLVRSQFNGPTKADR